MNEEQFESVGHKKSITRNASPYKRENMIPPKPTRSEATKLRIKKEQENTQKCSKTYANAVGQSRRSQNVGMNGGHTQRGTFKQPPPILASSRNSKSYHLNHTIQDQSRTARENMMLSPDPQIHEDQSSLLDES